MLYENNNILEETSRNTLKETRISIRELFEGK